MSFFAAWVSEGGQERNNRNQLSRKKMKKGKDNETHTGHDQNGCDEKASFRARNYALLDKSSG